MAPLPRLFCHGIAEVVFHDLTLSHATFKRLLSDIYWTNSTAKQKMQYIAMLYRTVRRLFAPCYGDFRLELLAKLALEAWP
jgi:hypothetical protein